MRKTLMFMCTCAVALAFVALTAEAEIISVTNKTAIGVTTAQDASNPALTATSYCKTTGTMIAAMQTQSPASDIDLLQLDTVENTTAEPRDAVQEQEVSGFAANMRPAMADSFLHSAMMMAENLTANPANTVNEVSGFAANI